MRALLTDLSAGFRRFPLASMLGWRDTVSAHRRSIIGPTWIFIQTFAWVFFIGILFGNLLGSESVDYLIYVAIGMVGFNFMTLLIADSANTFIRDASLLKNIPVPPTVYVLRVGMRAVYTLLFEIPVILIAFAVKGYMPDLTGVFLSIAALALTLWAFMGAAFGLAALGARVQDLVPAISVANRLAFFATPIFWLRDNTDPVREFLVIVNPLAHFLKIIRAPLMGMPWSAQDWLICVAIGISFWLVGILLFATTRDRLAALV